jgi:hypothetical protein
MAFLLTFAALAFVAVVLLFWAGDRARADKAPV